METETGRTRTDVLLIAGLAVLALAARLVPGQRMVDDAYITFRYARNLVDGLGFVYNAGEHVLGTTTPLYTSLLACLALVTGSRDFPTLAIAINALAGCASVGLLYGLGKRLAGHRAPAAAAALIWAVSPYSVTFAIGGMETDLTIALLLGAACAHVADRARAMAALSALALLARPDTAILLGPLWLDLLVARFRSRARRPRWVPWREGLIALLLLAPWLIFGTLYFGSPLTGSVSAKSITYRLPPGDSLVRLIQHYSNPFFEDAVLGRAWHLAGFVVYLVLCGIGGLRVIRRNRRAWPLVAYPYLYLLVFAAANPLLFRWYLSPPVPFYVLGITTGVWVLIGDLVKLAARSLKLEAGSSKLDAASIQYPVSSIQYHGSPITLRASLALFAVFALAALALTLNAWDVHPDHGPDRPAPEMAWFKLEQLYFQAADVVLSHAASDDTLCAGDIGMLGYRTGLHILDTVGLVTRESSRHYPADPDIYVINYAIPADLVLALDPDFVVLLEVYGRRGLFPDLGFQARYQLLKKIETDIYGSDGMLIFERAPASP